MNQQQPKVSVIIPVYNAEAYLRECLDSVISQTLRDVEILCVDDGSTDGSLGLLKEYEEKDSRIRVLTQPNINAGAARNNGLRYAKGEYLSFLDADDVFELDMLEKAYAKAKECDAQICVFRCEYFDEESHGLEGSESFLVDNLPEKRPFAGSEVKKNLFDTFVGWAWDKLFLREFIEQNQIRFQEQRTTNDLFFTYFALAKAKRITVTADVLVHHRTHVKSSLESTRTRSWECFNHALCALRDALQRDGSFEQYERAFVNYSLHFTLWNLYTLEWPTQELLYYKLKLVWLDELGLPGHEETYYDDRSEYEALQKILEKPYYDESPEAIRQRMACQEMQISDLNCQISELKASASFRIGRGVTWLPRKVRSGARRFQK